jgi:hypothetical protein
LVTDEKNFINVQTAANLLDVLNYLEIQKKSHMPLILEIYLKDPRLVYFCKSKEEQTTVLPLFQYIIKKTLCLHDYRISSEQATSLSKILKYFENNGINSVIFDNCGILDKDFQNILKGIQDLQSFKKIVYKNNEFGRLSLN